MRFFLLGCLFFTTLHAGRSPLSVEELEKEADQICQGRITAVHKERVCFNATCTNFKINGTATLLVEQCKKGVSAPVIKGSFFQYVYTEGHNPPLPYGHEPEPDRGDKGTLYLKEGAILYPNGWAIK